MKLRFFWCLPALVTLNVIANEYTELTKPSVAVLTTYFEYCVNTQEEHQDTEEFLLDCVNEHLTNSSYVTFDTYDELMIAMQEED